MRFAKLISLLLLSATLWGQATQPRTTAASKTRNTARRPKSAKPALATAEEVMALREALAAQQQQIQQLQQQMQSRDQLLQQTQQQLQQAQTATREAESRVAAVETTANQQKESFVKIQSDLADAKLNMTRTADNIQNEQKRVSALESLAGRFRFGGDVRVRQEDFFQDIDTCTTCVPRIRERIRLRFGVEGKLSEDFVAGLFVASGTVVDPTSTNETLTSAFERKTISWDRGYITYQPQAHKWLQLTGGKFAYTWTRTPQTFDSDLNPEGFSEKLSFDINKSPYLKNVTLTGLQLLFNEVSAPTAATSKECLPTFQFCANGANLTGSDSYAVGGQLSTKWKFGRITTTPSFTVLNWRNENTLLNQGTAVTGRTSLVGITPAGSTLSGTTEFVLGTASGTFAPNGVTNATRVIGTTANGAPILAFNSKFLYGDAILDSTIDTGQKNWPARLVLEYLNNMRAAKISPTRGRQSHLYKAEATVGQLKNRNDLQFSYGFWRQEQDSVIGAFNESDQRAPTNIVQHSVSAQWLFRTNLTLGYTLWIGRTLDNTLPNAARLSGVTVGQVEPYLKRMQFDAVYKF